MALFVAMLWGSAPVLAQEYIRDQEPVPESVDQVVTSYGTVLQGETAEVPRFFPWLKEQLKDTPPFFRDTKLNLNVRTYYFYREKYDNAVNEAWALGGRSLLPVRLVSRSLRRGCRALYVPATLCDRKTGMEHSF